MSTTNLSDLPTDTVNRDSIPIQQSQPLQSHANDNVNMVIANPSQELKIQRDKDTEKLNEFVTGIQQASTNGGLSLPNRDIPQETQGLVQDDNIKANYIPEVNNKDYINNNVTREQIISENNQYQQSLINTDILLANYKIPIILAILYFTFQTPYFQNLILKLAPSLYETDGNISIIGTIILSVLFASAYLLVDTGMTYLSN